MKRYKIRQLGNYYGYVEVHYDSVYDKYFISLENYDGCELIQITKELGKLLIKEFHLEDTNNE